MSNPTMRPILQRLSPSVASQQKIINEDPLTYFFSEYPYYTDTPAYSLSKIPSQPTPITTNINLESMADKLFSLESNDSPFNFLEGDYDQNTLEKAKKEYNAYAEINHKNNDLEHEIINNLKTQKSNNFP